MARASTMPSGLDRLSNRTKWAILAGLTLVLLVAILAAAEIAIRIRHTLRYGSTATVEQLYRYDERLDLRVPIPNLDIGRVKTNSLGFRGPEIQVPKPPVAVRIAFLGASTTWCGEVSRNDKVWPHLVAEDLRRAFPNAHLDYVNGGVPGYTIASSLKNLKLRVAPLMPDIIVIYHATNDMSGELRELAVSKGVIGEARVEPLSWLSDYSLLWNLAEKNWRVFSAQRQAQANVGRLEVDAAALGESFRRDLTALVKEAQSHAKLVAVATFATHLRETQTPDQQSKAIESALYYMPFMTARGLIGSYGRYNQIIEEVAAATGALLIGGERDIPGNPEHFTDSVHFTDAGSRRMADRVSKIFTSDARVASVVQRSAAAN